MDSPMAEVVHKVLEEETQYPGPGRVPRQLQQAVIVPDEHVDKDGDGPPTEFETLAEHSGTYRGDRVIQGEAVLVPRHPQDGELRHEKDQPPSGDLAG